MNSGGISAPLLYGSRVLRPARNVNLFNQRALASLPRLIRNGSPRCLGIALALRKLDHQILTFSA